MVRFFDTYRDIRHVQSLTARAAFVINEGAQPPGSILFSSDPE